jgi:hypothetical protein
MAKYKIYSWGDGIQISVFDISSILLAKFISELSLSSEFEIIPSSNIFDSNSGRLPVLLNSEAGNNIQVVGFIEILKIILKDIQFGSNKTDPKTRILYDAYLHDLVKNLELITNYNFFVVKKNYEGYTRTLFPSLLPWPTQYKPPVDLRNAALELCLNDGIIDDESVNIEYQMLETDLEDELQLLKKEEKNLRDTPVINDMQKMQMDKQLDIISQKKSVISNMQCIKKLKTVLEKFNKLNFQDDIFKSILHTYLKCNICDSLPENFIRVWLRKEYPELLSEIDSLNVDFKVENVSKISLSTALRSYVTSLV